MDEARFLHRYSEYGYTSVALLAIAGEPEALSEAEQIEATRRAQQATHERRRGELLLILDETRRAADWHAAQLRHHERAIRRLERRLAT